MHSPNKEVMYFIVVMTTSHKLISGYIKGRSISVALDKLIEQHSIAGNILEYKYCLVQEAI